MLNKSKATEVTAQTLQEEGIINKINDGIVILATGNLEKNYQLKQQNLLKLQKKKLKL